MPNLPYKIQGGRTARPLPLTTGCVLTGLGPVWTGRSPVTTRSPLGERTSAAAGLGRVRIHEHKALLYQGFVVIESHPVQIDEGLRVHKNPDISELKHTIALARLRIEPYVVTQARASATLHAQTKPTLLRRNVLFHHRRADSLERVVGHLDALGRSRGHGGFDDFVFDGLIHDSFCLPVETRLAASWFPARIPRGRRGKPRLTGSSFSGAAGPARGFAVPCFFFQSPLAARIPSSASTEQ